MFDFISYFEDNQIKYVSGGKGKNVGKGWTGIQCPFPHCGDSSQHLGINNETQIFHCWICGENGNALKLIHELEGCSWAQAKAIFNRYNKVFLDNITNDIGSYRNLRSTPIQIENTGNIICNLPSESTDILPVMHRQYLITRNFDPDKLQKQYKLKAVYNIGKYRGRLIIPCYLNNKIVSYLTRDVTGQSSIPYVDCPEQEAVVPVKHTLYNIDSVIRDAILVEGVTDVWRLGEGAIASFTSNMTAQQKSLLVKKNIRRLFILYDPDAFRKARKLANDLSPLLKIELILLDHGDPANLSNDDARILKHQLLK